MFEIKKHLAYSEDCFERPHRPGNRDVCICADFDSLPAQFGKGMVRIVMDGMSQANGKEAVEAAAPSLYLHLIGELMRLSRELSGKAEEIGSRMSAGISIREYLEGRMRGILLDGIRTTNNILRCSPGGKAYCTVSVAVIFHRYLFTANMGDSPILLLDRTAPEPELLPLYDMDNEAGRKIAMGELTEEEALHSEYQNGLLRFLGFEKRDLLEDENIHFRMTLLPASFVLLLGSDGALAQLPRAEMAAMLVKHLNAMPVKQQGDEEPNDDDPLREFLDELKQAVEETGSDDDFTLLADWVVSD